MTSFHNYNVNIPHFSNKEYEALKVEKDVYIRHIEKILDDATKFQKVKIKKGIVNFSINMKDIYTII